MLLYTTVDGHEIRYQPSPEASAFLDRLTDMVDDSKTTENDMIALGYSRENPLLSPGPADSLYADRGYVTKEVVDHPSYRVLTDLLARKRIAASGRSVESVAAEYTVTVAEAAVQLGISESAVRQAILARRLSSWVKGSQYYLHPDSVTGFERSNCGPKRRDAAPEPTTDAHNSTALEVHIGHRAGASMKLRHPGELVDRAKAGDNELTAALPTWSRVAVLSTSGPKARMFVIEPDATREDNLEIGGFFVRGRFRVTEKINNARAARAAFKTFVPA